MYARHGPSRVIWVVEESRHPASARVAHESTGTAGQLAVQRPVGRVRAGLQCPRAEIKHMTAHATVGAKSSALYCGRAIITVVVIPSAVVVAANNTLPP